MCVCVFRQGTVFRKRPATARCDGGKNIVVEHETTTEEYTIIAKVRSYYYCYFDTGASFFDSAYTICFIVEIYVFGEKNK